MKTMRLMAVLMAVLAVCAAEAVARDYPNLSVDVLEVGQLKATTISKGGIAVVTNATAATVITPKAPSAVTPTITVTKQTALFEINGTNVAVVTNVTAACSVLPLFITNATAATTVTLER